MYTEIQYGGFKNRRTDRRIALNIPLRDGETPVVSGVPSGVGGQTGEVTHAGLGVCVCVGDGMYRG